MSLHITIIRDIVYTLMAKSSLKAMVVMHCMIAKRSFNPFWIVRSYLELAGFRVCCYVSDGSSINRKFYIYFAEFCGVIIEYVIVSLFDTHMALYVSTLCFTQCAANGFISRNVYR